MVGVEERSNGGGTLGGKARRAQANVVSFTLLTLIILIIASISFIWGKGIIENATNVNDVRRVEDRMIELHVAIKEVANERSQRTVPFEIKDGWLLFPNNHTVRFESFGELPGSGQIIDERIIIGNYSTNGPCRNITSDLGRLGYDDPGCVTQQAGGVFEIKYVTLNDTIANECFGILLDYKDNVGATKGSHNILLTYNNTRVGSTGNCANIAYSVVKVKVD